MIELDEQIHAFLAGLDSGVIGYPIHPHQHEYGLWHIGYWYGFCQRMAQERAAERRGPLGLPQQRWAIFDRKMKNSA